MPLKMSVTPPRVLPHRRVASGAAKRRVERFLTALRHAQRCLMWPPGELPISQGDLLLSKFSENHFETCLAERSLVILTNRPSVKRG